MQNLLWKHILKILHACRLLKFHVLITKWISQDNKSVTIQLDCSQAKKELVIESFLAVREEKITAVPPGDCMIQSFAYHFDSEATAVHQRQFNSTFSIPEHHQIAVFCICLAFVFILKTDVQIRRFCTQISPPLRVLHCRIKVRKACFSFFCLAGKTFFRRYKFALIVTSHLMFSSSTAVQMLFFIVTFPGIRYRSAILPVNVCCLYDFGGGCSSKFG